MSTEEQLSNQIQAAIERVLQADVGSEPIDLAASDEASAVQVYGQEAVFLDIQKQSEQIKDMQSARTQREKYARNVFFLVAAWVVALFVILLAQGFCPHWHAFSDSVLIALISSMTVNLIGTLVIVLKYIFR